MEKDKRVIQAKEILNKLEEADKVSNLVGGFVTILLGCIILDKVLEDLR